MTEIQVFNKFPEDQTTKSIWLGQIYLFTNLSLDLVMHARGIWTLQCVFGIRCRLETYFSVQVVDNEFDELTFDGILASDERQVARQFIVGRDDGSFAGCVKLGSSGTAENLFKKYNSCETKSIRDKFYEMKHHKLTMQRYRYVVRSRKLQTTEIKAVKIKNENLSVLESEVYAHCLLNVRPKKDKYKKRKPRTNLQNVKNTEIDKRPLFGVVNLCTFDDDSVRRQVDPPSQGGCATQNPNQTLWEELFDQRAITPQHPCVVDAEARGEKLSDFTISGSLHLKWKSVINNVLCEHISCLSTI